MAVTKIHAIKSTLYKALNYILDPTKTDGALLVSGFNCEPATADVDFQMTALLSKEVRGDYSRTGGDDIFAHHVIQSFAKSDNLTPELAHEIGKQLADGLFKYKHEYVLATHIDKGHIHNHIIANATSFLDFAKFRTQPYKTVQEIRDISDRLCREHGLNVIPFTRRGGLNNKKWQTQPSFRDRLQMILDKAICSASSFDEFKDILGRQGVFIKEGKHIAFKADGQQRYIRGKSIGPRYEKEQIISRIMEPIKTKAASILPELPVTSMEKQVFRRSRQQVLREIREMGNMMILSRREGIDRFADFDPKVNELKYELQNTRKTLKELGASNAKYQDVARLLVSYNEYLPLSQQYEKLPAWRKKGFERAHGQELKIFAHAKLGLKNHNITDDFDIEPIRLLLKDQATKTHDLHIRFRETEERIRNIIQAKNVMARVLGKDQTDLDREGREQPKKEVGAER